MIDEADIQSELIYATSRIARINIEKSEGHIYNLKRTLSEKDFYFCFDDCIDDVKVGDWVKFIPAINISSSTFGYPKAYKVTKL